MRRAVLTVTGHVQEVGYRYYVQQLANRFDIQGTVCNVRDGSVRIEAEAEEQQIRDFAAHLRLDQGPLRATIERVDVQWVPQLQGYTDFTIVRSR